MKQNLLLTLLFIGMVGMAIALETNDKWLFLTNGLMVCVIMMHDIFHRNVTKRNK